MWQIPKKSIFVTVAVGLISVVAMATTHAASETSRPPPIGQRKYVFEKESAEPVTIEKISAHADTHFLKDPVQPGKLASPRAVVVKRKIQVAEAPKAKTGQMRFKRVLVNGHLIRPRVEFSRDVLPVGRADEPVAQDFFPKVFEPAIRDDY